MDEDFQLFVEEFQPVISVRDVPHSVIELYRGRLPDRLLGYWREHGWAGYSNGRFWTVNPQDYEPALDAWIGDTEFMEKDAYHVIGRSAFGELYFWGESTGNSLSIMPWDGLAFPTGGAEKYIVQGKADEAMGWFFSAKEPEDFDVEDNMGRPLFDRALKKLGALEHDEMYGFVPALALGGTASLKNLQVVKAVEHLVLLAQLAPLKVMESPFAPTA